MFFPTLVTPTDDRNLSVDDPTLRDISETIFRGGVYAQLTQVYIAQPGPKFQSLLVRGVQPFHGLVASLAMEDLQRALSERGLTVSILPDKGRCLFTLRDFSPGLST